MRGTVKFFNIERGYGYISPDDGSDEVWFGETSLSRDRQYDPVEGDRLEFETRKGKMGLFAYHIVMLPDPKLVVVGTGGSGGQEVLRVMVGGDEQEHSA